MPKFKSAAPKTFHIVVLWLISFATFHNKQVAKKLKVINEVVDFQLWVKNNFPTSKLYIKRENLWSVVSKSSKSDKRIIELGVAWGYTTNWFLNTGFPPGHTNLARSFKPPKITIDAFDLFTGLPEAWRNLPKNFFSNNGLLPEINDQRVTFHVGLVEQTIKKLNLTSLVEELIVLFDLDLYGPSLACYNHLKAALKTGDILYFDEAFDEGERKILENHVLIDFELSPIGHTAQSICLQIIRCRN